MYRIILGRQAAPGGLIRVVDSTIVTGESTSDVAKSVLRLLSTNVGKLKDQNLVNLLTADNLLTSADFSMLKEVLAESNLGLVVVDVLDEVGSADETQFSIVVTNRNSSSVIKPALIFHTSPTDLNEVKILDAVRDRFTLFPARIYGDTTFSRTIESELELHKNKISHTEFNMVALKNILNRIGITYEVVAK